MLCSPKVQAALSMSRFGQRESQVILSFVTRRLVKNGQYVLNLA